LVETNGDMDKAAGIIRKKGLAAAAKKAERVTAEGSVEIYVSDDNKSAGIVEFNCETDFVAANNEFITVAKNLAKQASLTHAANTGEFLLEKYFDDESTTVKVAVNSLIAKLGENMSVRRFEKLMASNGVIQSYIHGNGRIGVLVELSYTGNSQAIFEVSKNIAMQIAAANPLFLDKSAVDEKALDNKREVYRIEALREGKPEKVVEKIVEGKIQKYLKEVCLMEQVWVKDPDYTIRRYIEEKSNKPLLYPLDSIGTEDDNL
jgi:elongation factor Ts